MKFIAILSLFFLYSCDTSAPKKPDRLYYLIVKHNGRIDTSNYDKFYSQSAYKYEKVFSLDFNYLKTKHNISFFSNARTAPIDGAELFYTLDSLGIIYSRALSWSNYIRLEASNDSLNKLIGVSIDNILLYPNLHCFRLPPVDTTNETK